MPDEFGARDVVEQLDTRLGNLERGQRDLAQGLRDLRVELRGEMTAGFSQVRAEMTAGFTELRGEMDRRLGRMDGMLVTVLLALVIGVGGLWLK